MSKHEIMIIANYADDNVLLTLDELCEICNLSSASVEELMAYEIIHPRYSTQHELMFEVVDLQRVKTALRLQHDLELNIAGVALVLDLLKELGELRAQAAFLERHFKNR